MLANYLMPQGTIVFLGGPLVETSALHRLVPEFGWSLESAADLTSLRNLAAANTVIAVLFDARSLALSWQHALRLVGQAASTAFLIPCHRLSDKVDWPELADSGAFHALALPFDVSEVRQSLGFVSFARNRRAANVLSMPALERLGDALGGAMECRCGVTPCRCSGKAASAAVVVRAAR
jgi:hypothetical protein